MALTIDGSNGIILPVGSLTKPSLGTAGAGMHVPLANTLAFVTNTQSRIVIDSAGTVTVANNFVVSGNTTVSGTTIPASKTLVTTIDSQTLTNKTISGANNTLSNIPNNSLSNNSIIFGATTQALGSTVSGLNAVSIGASSASTGSFTTLTTSSTVTLNGGTANGVAYLNASRVLTTGTALTFDGTTFKATTNAGGVSAFFTDSTYSTLKISHADTSGNIAFLNGANQNYAVFGSSSIFYTSGTEQMRLTSTGLGIGTNSPAGKIHAYISSNAQLIFQNSSQNNLYLSGTNASVVLDATGSSFPAYIIKTQGVFNGSVGGPGSTASGISLTNAGGQGILIDSSGNLGLGVTPSAWGSAYKSIDIGTRSASFTGSTDATYISTNAYNDGAWKYKGTSGVGSSLYTQFAGSHTWFTAASGTAGNTISFGDPKMTLTAAGDLGIGTASPTGKLHVSDNAVFGSGASNQLVAQQTSVGGSAALALRSLFTNANNTDKEIATLELGIVSDGDASPSAAIAFKTIHEATLVERARITSAGDLLVGTITGHDSRLNIKSTSTNQHIVLEQENASTDGWGLRCYGGGGGALEFSRMSSTTSFAARMTIGTTGTITFNTYGAGTLSTNSSGVISASDGRYKDKTKGIDDGLSLIMQLTPTYYRWKENSPFASDYEELGFIAQEVSEVIPEASPEPINPEAYRNYYDRAILAVSVKAIQELHAEIESLKQRIA